MKHDVKADDNVYEKHAIDGMNNRALIQQKNRSNILKVVVSVY